MCHTVQYLAYIFAGVRKNSVGIASLVVPTAAAPHDGPGISQGMKGLLSVLIVDDSELIRKYLRAVIDENRELYICGEAENGAIAVEKVRELRPDAVILDLQMPVMNGLEAARQISKFAPRTLLLMYTGHHTDQLLKEAQAVGIREVFSKTDEQPNHLLTWLSNACIRH